ncbi:MAG: hypothetical protein U9Q81_19210 [Pseudomonadota bacterium]|nr:hypothetical protein [Pseudomonadota bacterium]
MNRRYICIPTVGTLEQNLERIRSHIRDEHLAHRYPVVRYERPQRGRTRGGGELYLFLGIDLAPDEGTKLAPAGDREFLKRIGFRRLSPQLLEGAQIKPMTATSEVSMEGFWFRYKETEIPPPPPTLEQWEETVGGQADEVIDDRPFEQLLWWLSARGKGSWSEFAAAIEMLELCSDYLSPAGIARNLVLLGHLESRAQDNRWSVAPRCWVTPILEDDVGFLAGARGPGDDSLADGIESAERSIQPGGAGPARIAMPEDALEALDDLEPAGPAAQILADFLPSLPDWVAGLSRLDRPSLGGGTLQRFDGRTWQPDQSLRETDTGYRGPSGLYRFLGEANRLLWQALFDSANQRWHRADLTGLKFAALALETGERLRVTLDPPTQDLLVPVSQRWPLLYERALVLASGWLPAYDRGYLRYRRVGEALARHLADRLGTGFAKGEGPCMT